MTRRSKSLLAIASLLLLAVSLALWMRTYTPPSATPTKAHIAQVHSPPPQAPAPSRLEHPQAVSSAPPADVRSVQEEAMLAALKHTDRGFVRCQLPPGFDVETKRLTWAGQTGAVLTMAVDSPSGHVPLTKSGAPPLPQMSTDPPIDVSTSDHETLAALADEAEGNMNSFLNARAAWLQEWSEPIAVAVWSDATPGNAGSCVIHPASDRVRLRLKALLPNGSAAASATAIVNFESVETDHMGDATLHVWPGVPQVVTVQLLPDPFLDLPYAVQYRGELTANVQADSQATISLREKAMPEDATQAPRAWIDNKLRETEDRQRRYDTPIIMALADTDLDPAVTDQLQTWLSRSEAKTADAHALAETMPD